MGGDSGDLVVGALRIPARELVFEAVRAGGPGGQNVNKVATQVLLRFDVRGSPSLSEAQRERIERALAPRLTTGGELILRASRFREQGRNRADALDRLGALLAGALAPRKPRRATRPTAGSRRRRLDAKRRRSDVKRSRRPPGGGD